MKNTEEQEITLIDSILPEVVRDAILSGDSETFSEAFGEEGIYNYTCSPEMLLECLRTAIACKNENHVGRLVIDYVTRYYNVICYDVIKQDLERYSEKHIQRGGYPFAEQNV
jgi:hypothetical protein